jgi:hypothetical protein
MFMYRVDLVLYFESDDPEAEFEQRIAALTNALTKTVEREGYRVEGATLDAATRTIFDDSGEVPDDLDDGDWRSFA